MKSMAACLIGLVFGAAACAPAQPAARADARESAYQENNRGVAELEQYAYEKAARVFSTRDRPRRSGRPAARQPGDRSLLRLAAGRGSDRGGRSTEAPAQFAAGDFHRWPDRPGAQSPRRRDGGLLARAGTRSRRRRRDDQPRADSRPGAPGERSRSAVSRARWRSSPQTQRPSIPSARRWFAPARPRKARACWRDFERVRERGAAITYSQIYLEQGPLRRSDGVDRPGTRSRGPGNPRGALLGSNRILGARRREPTAAER